MSDLATFSSGRAASMARRRALSAGKAALPPSAERTRAGANALTSASPVAAAAPAPAPPRPVDPAPPASTLSGRQRSMERRRQLSAGKQALTGSSAARDARPSGPARTPPAVEPLVEPTRALVSGAGFARGRAVTGAGRGGGLAISGAQHIDADAGAAWRAAGPKVGFERTAGGLTVSGVLVRSGVAVTGDERGEGLVITGEADPRIADDLTPRPPRPLAAFGRAGSRVRARAPAIEATDGGLAITGSAVGRSPRVTGDADGACRIVTGSQYLAPARLRAECGGPAAPAAPRPDPVTAGKVRVSLSLGGQKISGVDIERHVRVTGGEAGAGARLTGAQYQPGEAAAPPTAGGAVTGDTPLADPRVTGAARGAERAITGTPYHREAGALAPGGFSINPPCAARPPAARADAAGRITGAFAVGGGKVTGNLEFVAARRAAPDRDAPPPRARLTGEGALDGARITGGGWSEDPRVTGVEGDFAAARNPTRGGGAPRPFAGARIFKAPAPAAEPRQLVTGMFGFFSKTGARVTLSGGAQS